VKHLVGAAVALAVIIGALPVHAQFNVTDSAVLSVGAVSTRIALPAGASVAWICVTGTGVVFFKLGAADVVATSSDFVVLPGTCAALAYKAPQQQGAPQVAYLAAIEPTDTKSAAFVSFGSGHP
jgi:hypothetical protein